MIPPKRVYFAGPFELREQLREIADAVGRHRVTSRWIDPWPDVDEAAVARGEPVPSAIVAGRDLEDVASAGALMLWTHPQFHGRGSNFEAGYALALGKTVWRVGPALSPFHAPLPEVDDPVSFLFVAEAERAGWRR